MNCGWNRGLVVTLTFALIGAAAPAWAQVTLKKVLPQDKKLVVSVDTTTEQTLTLAGQNIESKSEQNAVQSNTYSKAVDGKTAVVHKVDALQLRLKAAGMDFVFDSTNPDKGADSEIGKQIAQSLKATLKGEWTSIHDPSGKVVDITGVDKLLEGLDAQTSAMVKSQLNPDSLKERLNSEAERIPTTPVKVGDTWEQIQNAQIGGGQTLTFKKKYTYAGAADADGKKLHRIDVSASEVKYSIGADSPLPLKLKSSELKVAESKGVLLFDEAAGRVVEENEKVRIKGTLTFEIGGQELPGELDLTITSTQKERP